VEIWDTAERFKLQFGVCVSENMSHASPLDIVGMFAYRKKRDDFN